MRLTGYPAVSGPRRHALAVACLSLAACADGPVPEPSLDEVRAATEKYRDVRVALADGYARDPLDVCETPYHMGRTRESGVMGVHYLRRDLLGIGEDHTRLDVTRAHTDFTRPAALLYEPQADGSLALVALENIVSAEAWEAEGRGDPPSLDGQPYAYHPADPAMTLAAHYDLHVWLFRENPSGLFAEYNPNATCEHHVFNMPMIHRPGQRHP